MYSRHAAPQLHSIGHEPAVSLRRGELFRLEPDGAPFSIACMEGCLWITLTGERRDRILRGGQAVTLQKKGLLLVEALRDSLVSTSGKPLPRPAATPGSRG